MITVIGLDGSPLSDQAVRAIARATLLVGGRRHLAAFSGHLGAASGLVRDQAGGTGRGGERSGADPGEAGGRGPGPGSGTAVPTAPRVIELGPLRPALDALTTHDGDAVVLASGDPGFFGIVRALRERGLDCLILPAVSSVALAFARAGLPWDDAVVVSAHGRELRVAVNVCRAYPKVAVLTGPGQGPAEIGAALAGWPRRLLVAEDLGGEGERITECSPAGAVTRSWSEPNVVLVLSYPAPVPSTATPASGQAHDEFVITRLVWSEQHQSDDHEWSSPAAFPGDLSGNGSHSGVGWCWPRWAGRARGPAARGPAGNWAAANDQPDEPGWALPEEAFEHRDSMVTKPEVRALVLARLGPGPGGLVWDVGAGSGSVAVECARFGAAVIAVDRDPAQCARVAANARRHGAEVRVVGGAAPEALDELPEPDAVFVGGGGLAVVSAVAARRPPRIVLALAAVERVGHAMGVLREAGYPVDGTLLQASRLAPLPDGALPDGAHRLAAANPVFVLWADLGHDPGQPGALCVSE